MRSCCRRRTRGWTCSWIRPVVVPAERLGHATQFSYDAVTCYMQVSAPKAGHASGHEKTGHEKTAHEKPMLGVYEVFKVLSGNLTLPYQVNRK
jgi:hypothetical protein